MTVKKATKILDWMIEREQLMADDLVSPEKSWNQTFNFFRDLVRMMTDVRKENITILKIVKQELVIKCNHPKKLRDIDPNRNLYCTNCNQNL